MNRILYRVSGRAVVGAVGLVVAGIALVGPAFTQNAPVIPFPPTRSPGPPDPPPSRSTHLTGKIQSVNGNVLTLTDGRRLVFLPGLTEQRGELKAGADVKASYAETAGRKVAVSIQVDDKGETPAGREKSQPPK